MTRRPHHEKTATEPKPPLGTGAPADLLVELKRPPAPAQPNFDLVRHLAQQLPAPQALTAGTWLAATLEAAPRKRLFSGQRHTDIFERLARAACCTALAALGYEQICVDEAGTAFGRVPDPWRAQ